MKKRTIISAILSSCLVASTLGSVSASASTITYTFDNGRTYYLGVSPNFSWSGAQQIVWATGVINVEGSNVTERNVDGSLNCVGGDLYTSWYTSYKKSTPSTAIYNVITRYSGSTPYKAFFDGSAKIDNVLYYTPIGNFCNW